MTTEAPETMSLLVPGVLAVLFVCLGATAWWLFRLRRRQNMRQELADELSECVRRLGLGTVWQAPLFQADVFGIRGLRNDFDVRAELWDKSTHEFFRLSIHFPQSTRQEFRIRAGSKAKVETFWRRQRVELGDERFDEAYGVYCHSGEAEQLRKVLTPKVRSLLLSLADDADGIKIGDHSLYLFVDEGVRVEAVERIIRDALAASVELYHRAREVGPTRTADDKAYERVSVDVLGRESGEFDEEEFPRGTGAFEAVGAGADDDSSSTPGPERGHPQSGSEASESSEPTAGASSGSGASGASESSSASSSPRGSASERRTASSEGSSADSDS